MRSFLPWLIARSGLPPPGSKTPLPKFRAKIRKSEKPTSRRRPDRNARRNLRRDVVRQIIRAAPATSSNTVLANDLRAKRIDEFEKVCEVYDAVAIQVIAWVGTAVRVGKEEEIDKVRPSVAVEVSGRPRICQRRNGIDR